MNKTNLRNKLVILPKLNDAGGDPRKKWIVYYSVKDPKSNKMIRFRITKGLGPEVPLEIKMARATQIMIDLRKDLERGITPFDNNMVIYEDELRYRHVTQLYREKKAGNRTFRVLASEYLKEITREKSEETESTYRSKLRIFNDWLEYNRFGDIDVGAITESIIYDFFIFLIDERELTSNTVRKYKNILTGFFEFVCKKYKTRINPMVNVPTTNKVVDEAAVPIKDVDMEKLKMLIKTEDPQLWLAMCFEYYCGLRPGKEIRMMRISDIDFTDGYVYINKQRAKTSAKRAVKIPRQFLDLLINEYKLNDENKSYYVFSKKGLPGSSILSKNNMRYRFNRFRDRLGLDTGYKFYSAKHTGAKRMLRSGLFTIEDIANHLGHENIKSTFYYIKSKLGWEPERIDKDYPDI